MQRLICIRASKVRCPYDKDKNILGVVNLGVSWLWKLPVYIKHVAKPYAPDSLP